MSKRETKEQKIIRFYKSNESLSRIRQLAHARLERVEYTINYYKEHDQIPDPKKRGRPPKSTPQVLNAISKMTTDDRTMSCVDISNQLKDDKIADVSSTSVYRYKTELLKFDYRPPKIRQNLDQKQIEYRKLFSLSMLQSGINLNTIIFSDESRFCQNSDKAYIWMKRGEMSDDVYFDKSKFDLNSIMVYGAIGLNFKSKLVFCENNIDEIEYRKNFTNSGMCEKLDKDLGHGQYIFMQDGAPAHRCATTQLFIKKRCSYIKKWPPNSPDLNPIEHVWGAIKRLLKREKITTKEELIQKVTEVWESFPQNKINELVLSFNGRLRTLIANDGKSISDILRKGINQIPQFPLPSCDKLLTQNDLIENYDPTVNDTPLEFRTKRDFEPHETLLLMQLAQDGVSFKDMAPMFEDRTEGSLRNKYNRILSPKKKKNSKK